MKLHMMFSLYTSTLSLAQDLASRAINLLETADAVVAEEV
jgi:hypothetical protein